MKKSHILSWSFLSVILTPGLSFAAGSFAGGVFVEATCDILWYVGGSFGALVTSAAILSGVVAVALGDMRLIISAILVAIGCYTMSDMVEMNFGDMGCAPAQGGRAGKSAEVLNVTPDAAQRESFESSFSSSDSVPSWGSASSESE